MCWEIAKICNIWNDPQKLTDHIGSFSTFIALLYIEKTSKKVHP